MRPLTLSPASPAPDHAAHVASDDARRAVIAILRRRGFRPSDIDDLTQDVLARALLVTPPPPTLVRCVGLVKKMAHQAAIDAVRRAIGRRRFDVGPPDEAALECAADPDATAAPDIADRRRQLAVVRAQIDRGAISARQATMLAMTADGAPRAEIAAHFGIAEQTVANELATARKVARASWAARAGAIAIAVAMIAATLAYWLTPRARIAGRIRPDLGAPLHQGPAPHPSDDALPGIPAPRRQPRPDDKAQKPAPAPATGGDTAPSQLPPVSRPPASPAGR
jgi:DNA-directed RNA polymerase specialized sigma24 family protein